MHVFVDESERGSTYIVTAVSVELAELVAARRAMRAMLCSGERRVHFNNEKPSRRRELLAQVVAAPIRARVYTASGRPASARQLCLGQLVEDLTGVTGEVRLIIESRSAAQDVRDRNTIATLQRSGLSIPPLTYEHLRAHEEPLLWAADGIAWAYGKAGEWRPRIACVLEKIVQLD